MPSLIDSSPPLEPRLAAAAELGVSRYEHVAGWLVSLLVVIGIGVVCLVGMWLTSRLYVPVRSVPVQLADVAGGSESGVVGESMALDAPSAEQVARDTDLPQQDFPQSVAAIAEAVAARRAQLDDLTQTGDDAARGGGKLKGTGKAPAKGQGDGLPGIPRANRWEIRFSEGRSLDEYARQLDFFHIELGLVGTTHQIHYLHQLAETKPQVRVGGRDSEERLYMSWRRGTLLEADRELARRAGLAIEGRVIVQFYPAETENLLAQLELKHAGRQAHEIRRTIFGVRPQGAGYEFHVIEQFPLGDR